jgi:type IV pilus assembly protein PilE
MDKKGVTLLELLIVIAIISVLAVIAIPGYIGHQRRAIRTEAFNNLQALRILEEQFFADNGRYAPDPDATRNYNGTHGVADNGIEDVLTGFKPGDLSSLNFNYSLTSAGNGTTFVGTATGKAGSRVAGETYRINQNNEIF